MKKEKILLYGSILTIVSIYLLSSCRTIPKGAHAVQPFDSKKYFGDWYEIARMDYLFEKNLNNATANYSMNKSGTIKVINRGYNYKTKKWKEVEGKAKFVSSNDVAKLKVSFLGPFYSGYNVIAIDEDYQYALVAGKNLKYLWILSREKSIPEKIKQDYLAQAKKLGYSISDLIWVEHDIEN